MLSVQSDNRSQTALNRSKIGTGTSNMTGTVTTAASDTYTTLNLDNQCVLWDNQCSGNRIAAMSEFFDDTVTFLEEEDCFFYDYDNCTKLEPAAKLSAFPKIKDWMRSPQCLSASSEYMISIKGHTSFPSDGGLNCCNICYVHAQNVDVYYWPQPNSNISCLSTVGTSINPPLQGATINSGGTYWGCTVEGNLSTPSFIKTATLTTICAISFKHPLVNPWSPPPCIGEILTSGFPKSTSIEARGSYAPIRARGHSLIVPTNRTQTNGLPVSTIVLDRFTF